MVGQSVTHVPVRTGKYPEIPKNHALRIACIAHHSLAEHLTCSVTAALRLIPSNKHLTISPVPTFFSFKQFARGLPWTALAAVGICWGLAIRILWPEWEVNPQYQYGMFLPALCAALFWLRWQDRPDAGNPTWGGGIGMAVAILSVAVLAVAQPVFEPNPDWRMLRAVSTLAAVAWTLAAMHAVGGLPWLRHFSFPICFLLVGVPWPKGVEVAVTDTLMHAYTGVVVEVLHWSGYAATREGHLIALANGLLGVEEACSGVRSLQSSLVAGLLFGEILRFRVGLRLALCGIGFLVAMVGNLVRTIFLSLVAVSSGTTTTEQWHDPAGVGILLATIGVLGIVAWMFQSRGVPSTAPSVGTGDFARWKPLFVGTSVVLLATWGATEAWFRMHEFSPATAIAWHLEKRGSERGATPMKIPAAAMDTLRYPEGFSEAWRDGGGRRWQWFYFRWRPGRIATQVTRVHNPTVCLTGAGMVLEKELPPLTYRKGDLSILFQGYLFTNRGMPLYVFHSISEDFFSSDSAPPPDGYELNSRLASVVQGRRNRGQRLLEFAVSGARDNNDAETALKELLDESITIEQPGSGFTPSAP